LLVHIGKEPAVVVLAHELLALGLTTVVAPATFAMTTSGVDGKTVKEAPLFAPGAKGVLTEEEACAVTPTGVAGAGAGHGGFAFGPFIVKEAALFKTVWVA
jgi:hypothetical protein